MRVLVVDDERRARERLARLLAANPEVEVVGEAPDGVAALDAIPRVKPDVLFLDVQMRGLTGLEVVDNLPEVGRPLVVFVTGYDKYAVQAFDVSAVDYLVKPVTADRVARALDRLRDRGTQQRLVRLVEHLHQTRSLTRIIGKRRQELHLLALDDVDAFVVQEELVFAITTTGRFLVEKTLRQLEGVLDGGRFVRIHRCAVVNLAALTVLQPLPSGRATGRLRSGQTIEISRRYVRSLRERLGW